MTAYRTVVVGTDGSDSSYRAVDRAAAIAGDSGATLVIACAYHPARADDVTKAQDELGDDVAYQVVGSTPAEETVRTAAERARRAGARQIDTVVVDGEPVSTLAKVVADRGGRPAGGRQPRAQHARRPHPRLGSGGGRPQVTGRRSHRAHDVTRSGEELVGLQQHIERILLGGDRTYTRDEVVERCRRAARAGHRAVARARLRDRRGRRGRVHRWRRPRAAHGQRAASGPASSSRPSRSPARG